MPVDQENPNTTTPLRARAVFLDRDGVINQVILRDGQPYPPSSIQELALIDGVSDALAELKQAGFVLVVVTNQPDVARGSQSREVVETMHQWLAAQLPIDEFRTCYHDDADKCRCRKPNPGMLLDAAQAHEIDISASYMIGDRWRDMEAARQAGCQGIFIEYGYKERQPKYVSRVVRSIQEASDWILQNSTVKG